MRQKSPQGELGYEEAGQRPRGREEKQACGTGFDRPLIS